MAELLTKPLMDGRTHAASRVQSFGGVGRNVADALGRLMPRDHPPPLFISSIGNDLPGESLLSDLSHLDTSGVLVSTNESTAHYTALLDQKGECLMGIGDMAAHMLITVEHVKKFQLILKNSPLLIIDGNIPQDTMDYILQVSKQNGVPGAVIALWSNIWTEAPPVRMYAHFRAIVSKHIGMTIKSGGKAF